MLDLLEAALRPGAGRAPLRALGLAAGPGSGVVRLLHRLPAAHCVAVDADPVLLRLGRGAPGDLGGRLHWLRADLRDPGLGERAAHRPGGRGRVDHGPALADRPPSWPGSTPDSPGCCGRGPCCSTATCCRCRTACRGAARPSSRWTYAARSGRAAPGADAWADWWAELAREPDLAAEFVERARLWPDGASDRPAVGLDFHVHALREAGFAEVAVVWQDLAEWVLMAVR